MYHNYPNNNVIRTAAVGFIVVGECRRGESEKVKVFICAGPRSPVFISTELPLIAIERCRVEPRALSRG